MMRIRRDGSGSTEARRARVDAFCAWLTLLWADNEGYARFAVGGGGRFDRGKYKFSDWNQRNVKWPLPPAQLRRQAENFVEISDSADVYYAPLLGRTRGRKRDNAIPGPFLYCDVDNNAVPSLIAPLLASGVAIAVRSGQNGHYYLHMNGTPEIQEFENLNWGFARALGGEKWERNALLRPPGTFNHKGRARGEESLPVVATAIPLVAHQPSCDLEWLRAHLPARPTPAPRRRGAAAGEQIALSPQPLPDPLPESLDRLRRAPVGVDRSGQTYRLVLAAVEYGLTPGQILTLVLDHQPSVQKYGPAIPDQVQRLVLKHDHLGQGCQTAFCPNAVAEGASRTDETTRVLDRLEVAIATYPWPPRTGRSEHSLVEAPLTLARRVGRLTFDASVRDLAELANMSRKTAGIRLRDAESHGWIGTVKAADRNAQIARRWCLLGDNFPPHPQPQPAEAPFFGCGYGANLSPAAADVFSHQGLGRLGQQAYLAIKDRPCSSDEVRQMAACGLRTAQRNLRQLADVGLARSVDGKWLALETDWDAIAHQLGVLGTGARRRARHEAERKSYSNLRAAVAKVNERTPRSQPRGDQSPAA